MSLEENINIEELQNVVKSSLLEINKLKVDIMELKDENEVLKNNPKLIELERIISDNNLEINELLEKIKSSEQEINYLNNQLKDKENEITNLNSKIEYYANIENNFNNIQLDFEDNIKKFKENELAEIQRELNNEKSHNVDKDIEIKGLNEKIINLQSEILDLSNNLNKNKEELSKTKSKIEDKNQEIQNYSKDLILSQNELKTVETELNTLKSDYADLKYKFDKNLEVINDKDIEIKNLENKIINYKEEITNLNSNIVSNDVIVQLKNEINSKNLELNEKEMLINNFKEHYIPKEKYLKIQDENAKKDSKIKHLEKANILLEDVGENSVLNDKSLKDDEVSSLRGEIEDMKKTLNDLEKIQDLYSRVTAPPFKTLSRIQSQIFNLLPDEVMSTFEIQKYINEVAFEDLSGGNISNILRSIEKKGYLKSEEREDGGVYWTKIE